MAEVSSTAVDTLAFVDEAGARGLSRNLTDDRDAEIALVCSLVFPADRIDTFRARFEPGYNRFIEAKPEAEKAHITDAFRPGNEEWAVVANEVRTEFYGLVTELQIPIIYEARRLETERSGHERLEELTASARATRRSNIKVPRRPSQSRVEEQLIIGLTLKLDAFCEDATRQRVDLYFDEIDAPLAKIYRAAMDVTRQVGNSTTTVKGWDPDAQKPVTGEIRIKAHASFPLDVRFVGDLHVAGKSDPLVLATDVVANALHYHLRSLPDDAYLNRPTSIAGWVLAERVYGVRDNAIEDLI